MLKPKYTTLSESVSDFNRMLEGMNRTQPIERMAYQEMEDLVREEQLLDRMDREVAHMESVLMGSGAQLTEGDRAELGRQYDQMADKYHGLANRAGRQGQRAARSNPALAAKMREVHNRLRRKAKEYEAKTKKMTGKRNLVGESLDPAPLSRYQSRGTALQSFRVLAGLEEQTLMPRDAGIFGSARHNADYHQMAEGEKWIQKAIKKPGALSKQLGVPEKENIPMGKLRKAAKAPGKKGKRARLAMTLKKLHK